MTRAKTSISRRDALRILGAASALAASGTAWGQTPEASPPVLMDGHVHALNRFYWEKADLWGDVPGIGWDFRRARLAGVNCIIDNLGTYGFWNYNYTPKQALRLIETALRYAEQHADKMAIATSVPEARRIISSGRMAVFLGSESGWDHEGDLDVLGALYRLGLRSIQFPTQSGYNAFADSALAMVQGGQKPDYFHGINERGRALVSEMNRLGILIDITHGTEAVHMQLIEASRAPVVASHETIRAISGAGLSDEVLRALAAKGGLVGIHGGAAVVSKRYRQWLVDHPDVAAAGIKPLLDMVGYKPEFPRPPGDHGEYIERFDKEFAEKWRAMADFKEPPELAQLAPTATDWAEHVGYVIKTVGVDHVAIGLDMAGGRRGVPQDAAGYSELVAALNKITTPANVKKITGENWFRVLEKVKA